jgi:thioester reductase-like protein
METVFVTGFPGFLGSELLPRVLEKHPRREAVCLVQPKFLEVAGARAAALEARHPELAGRIRLTVGDIVAPDLALPAGEAARLRETVREVYHLAAVYDLSVGRELAMRVNVEGTRHVVDLARRCAGLERLHYVSTCYVSGRYPGVFSEEQLEEGQSFNNFYEESKYFAEVEVQAAMRAGLPVTIYRPSIVVGDSRSGETQKYDGPYFGLQWLLRQPPLATMPVVGGSESTEMNVVPRDFVVDAIAHLAGRPDTLGEVFHLADPAPLTVGAMLRELARASGRTVIPIPMPLRLAKGALERVPGVYRLLRIPPSSVDYMVHPTRYGTARTRGFLEPAGIRVPPFPSYVDRLVAFVRANPHLGAAAMV